MSGPGVTFGRMERGSGTEAGQASMDVLAAGEVVGVIEAEMVDENERTANRAKRWRVVAYILALDALDDVRFPVGADGPRAALAAAKSLAVQAIATSPATGGA